MSCNFFGRLLVSLSVVACNFGGQSRVFADVNTKDNAFVAFSKDKDLFDKLRNCESQISIKANILVIGEKSVGKSKIAGSLLANTKKDNFPTDGIKMPENGFEHNKIYAAPNNEDLRVIELDAEELLNFDKESDEFNYLINNINHVFYIMDDSHKNLEKMAMVYDKMNRSICRNYGVEYDRYSPYSDDGARSWWKEVLKLNNRKWVYAFALLINSYDNVVSDSLKEYCAAMPNSRKIYNFPFGEKGTLSKIDENLIKFMKEARPVINPKESLSHNFYNKSLISRSYRPFPEKFAIGSVASLVFGLTGYGIYKGCTSKNKKQDIKQLKLNDKGRISGITKRYKQRDQFRVQQIKRIADQKKRNLR